MGVETLRVLNVGGFTDSRRKFSRLSSKRGAVEPGAVSLPSLSALSDDW
jgi:hypothetical protein